MNKIIQMMKSKKGQVSGTIKGVFAALVIALFIGGLAPTIMPSLKSLPTIANLTAAEIALLSLMGLLFVYGLVRQFAKTSGSGLSL